MDNLKSIFSTVFMCLALTLYAQKKIKIPQTSLDTNNVQLEIPINHFYSKDGQQLRNSKVLDRRELSGKNRITKKNDVHLKFTMINLFRYNVDFSVTEELIESYNKLDNYVDFSIDNVNDESSSNMLGFTSEDTNEISFEKLILKWNYKLQLFTNKFDKILNGVDNKSGTSVIPYTIIINNEQLRKIDSTLNKLKNDFDEKGKGPNWYENKVWNYISNNIDSSEITDTEKEKQLGRFNQLKKENDKLKRLIVQLNSISNDTKKGILKIIPSKKAGTIVTVNITLSPKDGEINKNKEILEPDKSTSFSIKYFVESERKFRFHTGYVQSSFKDIEFLRINDGSADVFQIVKAEDESKELSAFLSYQLINFDREEKFGLDLSIGTDYANPGEKIYFGGTIRIFNIGSLSLGTSLNTNDFDVNSVEVGEIINELRFKDTFGFFWSISLNAFKF